jgi:hypothetical protein
VSLSLQVILLASLVWRAGMTFQDLREINVGLSGLRKN